MRACGTATLATTQRDTVQPGRGGTPYASLVQVAFDLDATPVLLISRLADHTQNLLADPRCGLLFDGTAGLAEPLTGPRLGVIGRLEPTDDGRLKRRFLARHPGAAGYAAFTDFGFWRMVPDRAHLVAGFGRIRWIDAADLLLPPPVWSTLAERESDIVAHMNEDHADAIGLYATVLAGLQPGDWRMTGIDPEGCDLINRTVSVRQPLHRMVTSAEEARVELVRLVKQARRQAGEKTPD